MDTPSLSHSARTGVASTVGLEARELSVDQEQLAQGALWVTCIPVVHHGILVSEKSLCPDLRLLQLKRFFILLLSRRDGS